MNKQHVLIFLMPLILIISCNSANEQRQIKSNAEVCIDCGMDSIAIIWDNARTPADTLFAIMAQIDNDLDGPINLEYKTRKINELAKINKRLKLIDIKPYELYNEGMQKWIENDQQGAIKKIKQAIELFDKQKKIMGINSLLNNLRLYFSNAGLRQERMDYFQEKLKFYQENGPQENLASCYHAIAGSFTYIGDYNKAINYYLKAGDIYKTYSQGGYLNEILAAGWYYYFWGNFDKALQYINLFISLNGSTNSRWENVCEGEIILSKIYNERKQYQKAISHIDRAKFISDSLKFYQIVAISLTEKAGIFLELQQPDKAINYLNKAKDIRDSLSIPVSTNNGDLEIDYYMYKYHMQLKYLRSAETDLKEAYKRAQQIKDDRLVQKYRKALANFYLQQGITEAAAVLTLQYINFGDSLQNSFNRNNIASYENEQVEIKRELEIQQLEIQKKTQRNYFFLGGVFLLFISGGFYSRLQYMRKVRRQLEDKNLLIEMEKQRAEQTLDDLKNTQAQLIQSEKMASLGELTAGIAHEIQNPLNFVNNFSEVNSELIQEMKEEIDKGNMEEVIALANDIADNEQKINHHGKRADAIVKGMLQHSRSSSGVKEPTDINKLADEYLRLAYHGLRAKDKSFNATMKTDFDESIGNINIIPQDIGRVILNLITNAFYAVNEKKQQFGKDLSGFQTLTGLNSYEPTVSVSTIKRNARPDDPVGRGTVEVKVADNGGGIPQKALDKIFQPFFTTKPTGEGTGLGLSMSYEIVTKGHGGELKVASREGEGAEFTIILPL